MLSSSGISCRQGPHQLAQKLIMTTSPLNCVRLTVLPSTDCRLKAGACTSAAPSKAGSASVSTAARAAIRFLMSYPPSRSKEDSGAQTRLEIVGQLVLAQQG